MPGVYREYLKPIMPLQPVILKGKEWLGRDLEYLEFCTCNYDQYGVINRDLGW